MDRFIDVNSIIYQQITYYLKSNMDRFIALKST